jgi:GH25 family lysozyme M1 (1,4-beta-N-acetylmuramidase)
MKTTIAAILALAATAQATVPGFDISSYQPTVNFAAAYAAGARFVIIKVRT